jgi:hypothetical protein
MTSMPDSWHIQRERAMKTGNIETARRIAMKATLGMNTIGDAADKVRR